MRRGEKQLQTKLEQNKQQHIAQLEQHWQAELKTCEEKATEMLEGSAENVAELTAQIAALQAEFEKLKGTNPKQADKC